MTEETYPSWRYGPDGAARVCNSADDVPKGWADHPSKVKVGPLDHDGDGEKGGSLPGEESTRAKGKKKVTSRAKKK